VLREDDIRPTAIVGIAYDAEEGVGAAPHTSKQAVDDLRCSMEALASEDGPLLRAIKRPLTVQTLGRHRLGNLVIDSIAAGFGDYALASAWLGDRLRIAGTVLPATVEPVPRRVVSGPFRSPRAAVTAIEHADWVLLAPGSLYRSVIATAAVPDLIRALKVTTAAVLWIADREPGGPADPVGGLRALRSYGIRVDAVLYDSEAARGFDRDELRSCGVRAIPCALHSKSGAEAADPKRLRSVLGCLIRSPSPAAAGGPS
jgi:2-phospho-L-lactate transferase/gluconeogenesis factor (CofD/UPF0052 family)